MIIFFIFYFFLCGGRHLHRVFSAAYSYFESDMGDVQTVSNGKRGHVTEAMYNAGNDKILQFL